ncbi:2-oxo acid dehydrogenase subunit E2 [Streptomyces halobius]|uniref:2-oxo acid dehydrogenase subunit E2 n=1 Tax=Streptomyces halobius TaxID=2879846 RepID=A0ABY4MJF2_9ACTN|nr:2-oxo acid dehydrogenase subunit E2 [Streptomyces halobius]UQA97198.1 2-oxo acid dehydrogenase subunit E2 [Streptomyces halobius]
MSDPRPARPATPRRGFPKERSHIYYFLQPARKVAPLFALAPVDMSRVIQAQRRYRERGQRGSTSAATVDTPVVRDGQIVIRPVMNLVLASDHSAIDGVLAARVLDKTCRILEVWSDS